MTPETAVHIISQALWTTVLLCTPLLVDRLRGRHRRQHYPDRDFDAGFRV